MSKHPARVKIAILEFLEARLKDVVDYLTAENREGYTEIMGALLPWFKDLLKDISPKPDDYMAWLIENYRSITIPSYPDIFDAAIPISSKANIQVKVYDPFTTKMDFYLFLDVSWGQYLQIYRLYYDLDFKGWRQVIWDTQYSNDPEILDVVLGENRDDVFNASTSKSEIFYTIQQMKNILRTGIP